MSPALGKGTFVQNFEIELAVPHKMPQCKEYNGANLAFSPGLRQKREA